MIWNLTKTEKNKAQVTIYGPIKDFSSFFSSGGASPDKIMQDLDELSNAKEITVRINSGGGSAFAGFAIFELIRSHGAQVTTRIDGLAASAASIIAMAGDKIIMGTGAMMMIHNPWIRTEGESKDLRAAADLLDRVGESLINVYAARTGKSREELKAMLDKTTWLTAEEAVAAGFADEIDSKFKVAASIQGDSAVFNDQVFALSYFAEAPALPLSAAVEPIVTTVVKTETPKIQDPEEVEALKDIDELQAKHPDIYQAAVKVGADQERERIKSIDEISNTIADDLVVKAKYETPITAEALAFQALKADAGKGLKHLAEREAELLNNTEVKPGTQTEIEANAAEVAASVDLIAASANQGRSKMEAK
jgi:ATP-dependent Clp protease protease subunit